MPSGKSPTQQWSMANLSYIHSLATTTDNIPIDDDLLEELAEHGDMD